MSTINLPRWGARKVVRPGRREPPSGETFTEAKSSTGQGRVATSPATAKSVVGFLSKAQAMVAIDQLRLEQNLSQKELGRRVGIEQSKYSNLLYGKKPLTAKLANALRDALAPGSSTLVRRRKTAAPQRSPLQ